MAHWAAQGFLDAAFEFFKDFGGKLNRCIKLVFDAHLDQTAIGIVIDDLVRKEIFVGLHIIISFAHEALDREDGIGGIGGEFGEGLLSNNDGSGALKMDDGGHQGIFARMVGNNEGLPLFHVGH